MLLMTENSSKQNYKLYLRSKHIILGSFLKISIFLKNTFISYIDMVKSLLWWMTVFSGYEDLIL